MENKSTTDTFYSKKHASKAIGTETVENSSFGVGCEV
jgi:hypothetical protein